MKNPLKRGLELLSSILTPTFQKETAAQPEKITIPLLDVIKLFEPFKTLGGIDSNGEYTSPLQESYNQARSLIEPHQEQFLSTAHRQLGDLLDSLETLIPTSPYSTPFENETVETSRHHLNSIKRNGFSSLTDVLDLISREANQNDSAFEAYNQLLNFRDQLQQFSIKHQAPEQDKPQYSQAEIAKMTRAPGLPRGRR